MILIKGHDVIQLKTPSISTAGNFIWLLLIASSLVHSKVQLSKTSL